MFGIGFWELILVLVVAIIVINPKDLPKILYNIGYFFSRAQTSISKLKDSYLSYVDYNNFTETNNTETNSIQKINKNSE